MGTHVKIDNKVISRDLNRFRKVYRYIRKKPQPLVCDDGTLISDFVWGAYFVEFKDQNELEHYFPCCYNGAPAIVATSSSKSIPGASVWTDAGGAGAASVVIRCFGAGSASFKPNVSNEFIHLKNADGSLDAITFGGTVYSSAVSNHSSRVITRTLSIDTTSSTTWDDFISTVVTAINADGNIQWVATDNGDTGPSGEAKFTLTSKTGNKGPRPTAIANPATTNSVYDSWGLTQARLSTGTAAELFQVSVADGTGTQGSLVTSTLLTNSNYNVFVTDITNEKCTFKTSGNFTGYVQYQAIKDGVYTMPDIGRTMEVKTLTYSNTNTKTYTFTVNDNAGFGCTPIVTATADNDVNVYITALTKTTVTVEVSQSNYTGNVYIQAIEKGC
jgi:hypothetical protein